MTTFETGEAQSTDSIGRTLPSDFRYFKHDSRELYLHRTLTPYAESITERLNSMRTMRGAGNRGGGFPLELNGASDLFVRVARRGGLVRFLLSDLYLGHLPRPLRELEVSLEARRRGIPVAEPLGAMVSWVAPLIYRGFFLTRALSGMTLWEFLRLDQKPAVRSYVLDQAGQAIETMHSGGLRHADLNLHNLFVTTAGDTFTVTILDLDKARLYPPPLPPELIRAHRQRLMRSARKLDPAGRYLDSSMLERLAGKR